jgi:hypothetical protein
MDEPERDTAPHSSEVRVDNLKVLPSMLAEERPREEITTFAYVKPPANPSRYTEKKEIAVEKFQN